MARFKALQRGFVGYYANLPAAEAAAGAGIVDGAISGGNCPELGVATLPAGGFQCENLLFMTGVAVPDAGADRSLSFSVRMADYGDRDALGEFETVISKANAFLLWDDSESKRIPAAQGTYINLLDYMGLGERNNFYIPPRKLWFVSVWANAAVNGLKAGVAAYGYHV